MGDILGYVFEGLSALVMFFYHSAASEPDKEYKKLSWIWKGIPILYFFTDFVFGLIGYDFVFMVLRFLHRYPAIVFLYVGGVAVLSPAAALYERKKCGFISEQLYAVKNCGFNLLGALAACIMFLLAYRIIPDFSVLKRFQIEGIVSIFLSMSIVLVLLYQSEEQIRYKNGDRYVVTLDHDPGIQWFNQKINMLHLFNTYFFSLISVVYVVTYTVYCRIYHIHLVMDIKYVFFLVIAMLFFYSLSAHPYEYLYMIFLTNIPVILVCSVYWMSWFVKDTKMMCVEILYIILNLISFTGSILLKNRILVFGKAPEKVDDYRIKWKVVWCKSGFYVFTTFIAIVSCLFVGVLPLATERIEAFEAENYICAICRGTGRDAEQVIEEARDMETYENTENRSYDKMDYMEFINKELESEIVIKHIKEEGGALEYDDLSSWYLNIPVETIQE